MICTFERLIFPRNVSDVHPDSYVIAQYHPCERLLNSRNESVTTITAVGYGLPVTPKLRYELTGRWVRNNKYGTQYQVEAYTDVITPTKAGIIAYLSSGQIKGVRKKMAQRIYDTFGEHTLEILDKDPDKLLEVKGISPKKLERICESYESARAARYVIAYLASYNISPKKALKLYRTYRSRTLEMVQQHPYVLQEVAGIGFLSADKIAMSIGINPMAPERVDAGLLHTLEAEEEQGHLCMEKREFVQKTLKLLNTQALTEDMVAYRASVLVDAGKLSCYRGMVYRSVTAQAEQELAQRLSELAYAETPQFPCDFHTALDREERKLGYRLDEGQRNAVFAALACSVCVITGGPGTGKTATQRTILNLYHKMYPAGRIICCAPTGRAARRMTESTGYPSSTIHSALGLNAGDDLSERSPKALQADFVLVDEISMLDIHLANFLVQSIPDGCQLVLVGDADQLPSVGPGAVLRELTKYPNEIMALVALNKVHRQSAGSRIAVNASRIRMGNLSLEYGDDFQLCETSSIEESAALIEQIYLDEISKHGVDNVLLLSPYRKNTATGVNALNKQLQAQVNPPHPQKAEVIIGQRCFRVGDKVMQTRNHQDISNGDVGYITDIVRTEDDTTVYIDFGDNRQVEYDVSDLSMLDLGYALTVHKSQGSESLSVIISVESAHSFMLVRPLIYTAITRAKTKVILVGQRKALCTAIRKQETQQRRTLLAERMKEIQSKN